MIILLTGHSGQVGYELGRCFAPVARLITLDRGQWDLSDIGTVYDKIIEIRPDIILNAAAYTDVSLAESERCEALRINHHSVGEMARAAADIGSLIVHYSTDYVFDGSKRDPYLEDDLANPLNTYGYSKYMGEVEVLNSGCPFLIFRTSWVYSERRSNFMMSILEQAFRGGDIKVVCDQFGTPASAEFIAKFTKKVLTCLGVLHAGDDGFRVRGNRSYFNKYDLNEKFNLVPSGYTNWFEYSKRIVDIGQQYFSELKVDSKAIKPIASSGFPSTIKRPKNSRLDISKLKGLISSEIPHWEECLSETLQRYQPIN